MKTQLIFSIIFISMLILPSTLNAQGTDPAAVAISSFEAFNAGDSEASVAYYADDAVVNVVPFGTHTGHEEIRAWMEKNVAVNGILTWETINVDGDTVTLKSWYTDDELKAIGITLEADEKVTVKDGKIIEDTWVVTEESMAAMPPEAMTPEEVVMAMIEAESAGDVETQIALFADDAVYAVLPSPPDMPEPIVGTDAIRARRAGLAAVNGESTTEITKVDGNIVTTLSRYTDDGIKNMGLDYIEGVEEYVIEDGKITSYTWTMTDESMAAFMAAMPPEAMPESGGTTFSYVVALLLGGLAILGGAGLMLRRRYPT